MIFKASQELKFWNWRGQKIKDETLGEDEEGEVIEKDDVIKDKDEL